MGTFPHCRDDLPGKGDAPREQEAAPSLPGHPAALPSLHSFTKLFSAAPLSFFARASFSQCMVEACFVRAAAGLAVAEEEVGEAEVEAGVAAANEARVK